MGAKNPEITPNQAETGTKLERLSARNSLFTVKRCMTSRTRSSRRWAYPRFRVDGAEIKPAKNGGALCSQIPKPSAQHFSVSHLLCSNYPTQMCKFIPSIWDELFLLVGRVGLEPTTKGFGFVRVSSLPGLSHHPRSWIAPLVWVPGAK